MSLACHPASDVYTLIGALERMTIPFRLSIGCLIRMFHSSL